MVGHGRSNIRDGSTTLIRRLYLSYSQLLKTLSTDAYRRLHLFCLAIMGITLEPIHKWARVAYVKQ